MKNMGHFLHFLINCADLLVFPSKIILVYPTNIKVYYNKRVGVTDKKGVNNMLMEIGLRIREFRKSRGLTQQQLADKADISRSYLADVERNRYNPSLETLEKIANALEVSLDRIISKSANSIIEARLDEIGMTLPELAEKADVPLTFLEKLNDIVPDFEVDLGEQSYKYITNIAWILGLPGSELRLAFARQEIPIYDGPQSSPEEDFTFRDNVVGESQVSYNIYPNSTKIPVLGSIPAKMRKSILPKKINKNFLNFFILCIDSMTS